MRKVLAWLGFTQPGEIVGKNEAVRRMLALSEPEVHRVHWTVKELEEGE